MGKRAKHKKSAAKALKKASAAAAKKARRPVYLRPRLGSGASGKTKSTAAGLARFAGGDMDRLTADFQGTYLSANEDIRRSLRRMRARSRTLWDDNDYARRFGWMLKQNVVGARGIELQGNVRTARGRPKTTTNQKLEIAWKDWSQLEFCTVTRRISWVEAQQIVIETIARDGEVLIRGVSGWDSPYGFAIQILEGDYLDEELNSELSNGNRIIMGVEVDQWNAPVAYWLRTQHPGDLSYNMSGLDYDRIPASQILHLYMVHRPGALRGVPWMHTAIRRLHHTGDYEESELVASRISAQKMGFYTTPDGSSFEADGADAAGNLVQESEAGLWQQLPEGMQVDTFDPQHPNSAFGDFVKSTLRGAAAGLNVSYNALANNLEGVNFSSMRSGINEERDYWRLLQTWFADHFHQPVYRWWLGSSLLTGALDLPPQQFPELQRVIWQGRGWAWVDPLKDNQANTEGVALGTETRSEVCARKGTSFEEVIDQLAIEQQMAADRGVNITPGGATTSAESAETGADDDPGATDTENDGE